MRISDWSSDVCSSDLRLPGSTGFCRTADESSLQSFLKSPVGKYPPLPTTLELRTLLHWRDLFWRAAGRSEEHTSELQSLMRISYAVFCLKKKNKTIQTISDSI